MQMKTIAFWVLKILLAIPFLAGSFFKLSSNPMMVTEFGEIGFGLWFMYFTGAFELLCAVLLLVPRATFYGGIGIFCVCTGAFAAQYLVIHQDMIHTLVLGGIAAGVAFATRPGLGQSSLLELQTR